VQQESLINTSALEPSVQGGLLCGVDGGLTGGIVLLGDSPNPIKIVMPVIKVSGGKGGKGIRTHYNEVAIRSIFVTYAPIHVFVEQSQPFPGQGVSSMFSLGLGHGLIRGILAGLQIPYSLIHPRSWQTAMFKGIPSEVNSKGKAFIICQRLWPTVDWRASERSIKAHDGLCDAALIALYGRRTLSGQSLNLTP
jgi:crossover junction endodeoxyribonuclease RuvC